MPEHHQNAERSSAPEIDSRQWCAAIVESSDDAIVSKDLDGTIRTWNSAASQLLGYSQTDIVGHSILEIVPADLHPQEREVLSRLSAGEKIRDFHTSRLTKDKKKIEVSLTISPIRNSSGGVIGASTIIHDVSAATRATESRFRLAAIFESSEDAIISKNLEGTIASWNRAASELFGYTAEEIVGKSVLTLIPPELHHEEAEILRKLRSGERIQHHETTRVRKDGSRFEVALTISPILDDTGKVVGGSKIARDITGIKQNQEAKSRLAAIVESSDDAIVSKDLNGVITSWNKGAERVFGYTAAEIIGQPVTTIIPSELQKDEPIILETIRSGKLIDHFETIRLHKNGDRLNVSLTVSPIRNEAGKIIGAAKIARDVTKQKRIEAALHMTERLASVGKLAATVAHEINNPLEAVTNFIYLATLQPGLPEKVQRYLGLADKELARIAHLAQQTLGFYRRNSHPTDLNVLDIVQDVLRIFERKIDYKHLEIQREVQSNLHILGYPGDIKQVLSNLVGNAIEASPHRGKIRIRAHPARHLKNGLPGLRITIADRGSGIPRELKEKVFIPFFTTKRDVGTGLGLWISKEIIEKEGGTIHFHSRVEAPSGTIMSFYLPYQDKSHQMVQ